MKIAVIGAGAMGSIYGGRLSLENEVYLIDRNEALVEKINREGLVLVEDQKENRYYPKALTDSKGIGTVDLIIVFVKALFSKEALTQNRHLIGPDTYILTLQNGAGHEDVLLQFVDKAHTILGTTEDNGAVLEAGKVRRGGIGKTNLGMLSTEYIHVLEKYKAAFDKCGFICSIYEDINRLIWDKLFTNVSLSAVTAVLQVPIGYIARNEHAWNMTVQLIHEAILTAQALGMTFDEQMITERVRQVSINSPEGLTSIYMDVKNRRLSEVDTISGAVVKAAQKANVSVPTHQFVVEMVHALEEKY